MRPTTCYQPRAMARKVTFFTTRLGGGGAESHTLRVANDLDRARWAPQLAVTKRGGNYEQFLRPDIPVQQVSFSQIRSSTLTIGASLLQLPSAISRFDPDLVCAVMEMPGLVALASVRLRRRRPTVVCVQAPPLSSWVKMPAMLKAIRYGFPHMDGIIALSHGVKRELCEIEPSLEPLTTVIHNACVDERITSALQKPLPTDLPSAEVPVILAAGRLSPEKRVDRLIDAFAALLPRTPSELWILGEGPLKGALEKRASDRGVRDHVKFLGFRSNPFDFMRRATVFALTSAYEGFGNVIVEALACGAPVVATDCPYGPREIIEPGKTGFLVPPDDIEGLAAAIERVVTDAPLRASMSKAGVERAKAFASTEIAAQYADLFDRIVAR